MLGLFTLLAILAKKDLDEILEGNLRNLTKYKIFLIRFFWRESTLFLK